MNKRCDRKGWIHDTEENTLLLVWEREEIPISFKVHFWKRYGREGIYQFYKFRALRYQRLKKIAEIQKKSGVSFQFETRLRCLLECFEKIMEKTEGEGKKNGRS